MTVKVEMRKMRSRRLGAFALIKVGHAILISPCDTRMRILEALSNGGLTSEQISAEAGASYSCVMDHMDLLEELGVVKTMLKKNGGRRRVYFHLSENPIEGIERLFMRAPRTSRRRSAENTIAAPLIEL
jgi:predicted ArsR family transcriptional regulator